MQGGFFIQIIFMQKEEYRFGFDVYESSNDLSAEDKKLIDAARAVTGIAYAPYSNFQVGAVAKLKNGETISGTNQENASYPVGICAERVLLASAAMLHTDVPVETMAIAYNNINGESNKPVSPCGMCRQYISEYETRMKQPIRLILSGMNGKVFIIEKASQLLPLSFGGDDLK
jgi:cytidine deaminase